MKLEVHKLVLLFRQHQFQHLWCVRQRQLPSFGSRTCSSACSSKNREGIRLLKFNFCDKSFSNISALGPRSLSTNVPVPSNLQNETSLKKESCELQHVYTGPLTRMVKMVKVFSLSTSAIGLAVQPLLITKALPYGTMLTLFIGGFIGLYAVLTPLILHWVAKRYVVSLHFDPQSKIFTYTTFSLLLRERRIQFSADDVYVPGTPGPLTSFVVKNKPLLIDPEYFTDPNVYAHLMGYDKPLNIQLDPIPSNDSASRNTFTHKTLKET